MLLHTMPPPLALFAFALVSFALVSFGLVSFALPAFVRRAALAALIGAAACAPSLPAHARDADPDYLDDLEGDRQGGGRGEPGQFDFFALILSWSPSFCADIADRNPGRAARDPQCGARPFSFVVHGLWPQYERGYPQYCQVPPPRLNRNIVSGMLDLMPAPQLVFHEWDRHGVCSGLSPGGYFETIRKARALVNIPQRFTGLTEPLTVSPDAVEEAFIAANPGLPADGISLTCRGRRLGDVRICLTRDLRFRSCEQLERRSCRRDEVVLPPVR